MIQRLRLPLPLTLLVALPLTQCAGPHVGLFRSSAAKPYGEARETYRVEAREWDQRQNQYAYERGLSDGRADANAGEPKSYTRHDQNYTLSTRGAYVAGYDEAYAMADAQPRAPAIPGYPAEQTPEVPRDPAYNQGYDYGLRDRVAGKPADVDAHTGRYDPRFRRSFERGYQDAYESRRGN